MVKLFNHFMLYAHENEARSSLPLSFSAYFTHGQGAVAPWEHATLVSNFQSLRGFEPRQVQQSFSSQRVALLTEYHSACLNRYYDLNITHRTEGVTPLVIQDMGGLVYESRPTVCGAPGNSG